MHGDRKESQDCPAQHEHRSREVDHEACHIHERGYEGGAGGGGVDAATAQEQREHGPGNRPPQHDAATTIFGYLEELFWCEF